jgi:YgiT-type zinc finger domain-containing protein
MKCVMGRQTETHPGQFTEILERGDSTIIFKPAPAEVCENCGEYYLSEAVTGQLLTRAEQAVANGAEVEIGRFAA